MICFLLFLASAEQKTMNLVKFFDGTWNSTVGFISPNGEYTQTDTLLNITFDIDEDHPNSLYGKLKGSKNNCEFNIVIDENNTQQFTIKKFFGLPQPQHVTKSEFIYHKRNQPVASGQWTNSSLLFKATVVNSLALELLIFRADTQITEVYRMLKTPRPEIPSIWSAIRAPVVVGVFFIAYRLLSAHQMIKRKEKRKELAAKEAKKE